MGDFRPDELERLREAMRRACAELFEGNATHFAKALGRSQPTISVFVGGEGGISLETARRFADLVGMSLWSILEGEEPSSPADKLPTLPDTVQLDDAEKLHVLAAMSRGVTVETAVEVLTNSFAYGGVRPTPEAIYRALRDAQVAKDVGGPIGTSITEANSNEVLPDPKDVAKKRQKRRG